VLQKPRKEGMLKLQPALEQAFRALEQAFRAVFHRLNPYQTGLIRARAFMEALQQDCGVREAVESDEQRVVVVQHLETLLQARSRVFNTVRENLYMGGIDALVHAHYQSSCLLV
jgi:hypothetical protein